MPRAMRACASTAEVRPSFKQICSPPWRLRPPSPRPRRKKTGRTPRAPAHVKPSSARTSRLSLRVVRIKANPRMERRARRERASLRSASRTVPVRRRRPSRARRIGPARTSSNRRAGSFSAKFIVATTGLDLREVPPNRRRNTIRWCARCATSTRRTQAACAAARPIVTQPKLYAELVGRCRNDLRLRHLQLLAECASARRVVDAARRLASGERSHQKSARRRRLSQQRSPHPCLIADDPRESILLHATAGTAGRAGGLRGLASLLTNQSPTACSRSAEERAENFFKVLIYTGSLTPRLPPAESNSNTSTPDRFAD